MCSLGIEPTTFALLTQCSTTGPQEHCVYNTLCLKNTQLQWIDQELSFLSSNGCTWRSPLSKTCPPMKNCMMPKTWNVVMNCHCLIMDIKTWKYVCALVGKCIWRFFKWEIPSQRPMNKNLKGSRWLISVPMSALAPSASGSEVYEVNWPLGALCSDTVEHQHWTLMHYNTSAEKHLYRAEWFTHLSVCATPQIIIWRSSLYDRNHQ